MEDWEHVIYDLKHEEFVPIDEKSIQFPMGKGEFGYLRPVAAGQYSDQDVSMMWTTRTEHGHWAYSTFHVTKPGTQKWLDEIIIPAPDGILFMIEHESDRRVGHIGLQNIAPPVAEIGYVMRGSADAPKGIMSDAMRALMGWASRELGITTFTARVWSDNIRSLNLFVRNSFVFTDCTEKWLMTIDQSHRQWVGTRVKPNSPRRFELTLGRKL